MGVITTLKLSSTKAKNGAIETGVGESIPVTATVTGTDAHEHSVIFELIRDAANEDFTVLSFGANSITLNGANFPVNQHKNKWINIDTSWVGPNRTLLQCTRNTADTLYFKPTVNLAALGYTGVNPCRITNIAKWQLSTIAGNVATATFETTSSSFEPYLGTSAVFGIYMVQAYSPDFVVAVDELELHIVLLSIWQLRDIYLAGIPMYYLNPAYPADPVQWLPIFTTDDVFYRAIEQAIKEFEQRTQLFLTPKRVYTNPDATELPQTDIAIAPLDFESNYEYLYLKMPHHHIISLTKIEGWFGSQKVIEWNPTWYQETLDKRAGVIQMVPMLGGIPYHNTAMPVFDFISRVGWPQYVAGFWHMDYITGWDEAIKPLPGHFLSALGKLAMVTMAPGISDAITRGLSSSSVSLDGISESKSYGAGGTNHIFSARVKQYQDELKEFFDLLFRTEIPIPVETI